MKKTKYFIKNDSDIVIIYNDLNEADYQTYELQKYYLRENSTTNSSLKLFFNNG